MTKTLHITVKVSEELLQAASREQVAELMADEARHAAKEAVLERWDELCD